MIIQGTARVTVTLTPSERAETAKPPSILPEPRPPCDALSCAAGALYLLIAKRRDTNVATSKGAIDAAGERQKACLARQQAAAAREQANTAESGHGFFGSIGKLISDFADDVANLRLEEALSDLGDNADDAWNSPRFWKDLEAGAMIVAKVAAVAGAACATVATFGSAAPVMGLVIAGVVLSSASIVDGEAHVLEKCGVDPELAGRIRLGMSVAGSACSLAGGIWNIASIAPSAAASTTAATTATTVKTVASSGAAATGIVGGAASAAAGGASMRSAEFAENAGLAGADRKAAEVASARVERLVVTMIDALKENEKSTRRTLEGLSAAIETYGQTLVLSTARA